MNALLLVAAWVVTVASVSMVADMIWSEIAAARLARAASRAVGRVGRS
jgi:hypothetical protein